MATVSSVVYRTQATFRKLTGKEDWRLDVPKWVPASQVDDIRTDAQIEEEEEETALEYLERQLGM